MGESVFRQKSLEDVVTEYGDAASFVLVLLGQVYMQTERKLKAVEALNRALKLNPFLWAAFELLCRLGEKPEAEDVFQLDNLENFSHCHGTNPIASLITTAQCFNHSQETVRTLPAHEPMSVDQTVSTPVLQPNPADSSVVNTRYDNSSSRSIHPDSGIVMFFLRFLAIQHSVAVRASHPPQYSEFDARRSNDSVDSVEHYGPDAVQERILPAPVGIQSRPSSVSYVSQVKIC